MGREAAVDREGSAGGRQRPRDRKRQILETAGALFAEHGFHNVTMNQIASEVGITAGALYRHFKGKEEILNATLAGLFAQVAAASGDVGSLDGILQRRAGVAAELPTAGVLWSRESRHLSEEDRAQLVGRLRRENRNYRRALREERPALTEDEAALLAWAMQSVLVSTSGHIRGLSAREYGRCLLAGCRAVAEVELQSGPGEQERPSRGFSPVSKREKLLAAAVRLFGERGFQNTSLADIGAAADISGPSLYTHFASKADILVAVLARASHALWLDLHATLSSSATEAEALDRAVETYVDLCRSQRYLVSVLVSEVGTLPESRRGQLEYVQEWVSLLMAGRPELTSAAARALVRAAMTVINNLNETPSLTRLPGFYPNLVAIARAILRAKL
ncbi:TetR/AcrR family transcriptional regulator [Saccharopolyspora elongata]|uniref:TetR/AcrR family transcriptional regulator n=1 Tax=Saccharopolyspora elongata TaxID=2530387 RepID=A0A4R4Z5M2_9PSEU|nr:TetR/AcrR family transcriptional regulator [Saccharopolyspora elongata]TDD52810.1 TetR/AcrR family transcriptional regulator [Saccharopolyspora elongata]